MAIDVETRRPKLSNVLGGLSGPAIRPIAVRMVWECRQAVKLPILGMGGIATVDDALEFIIAGADGGAGRHGELRRSVHLEDADRRHRRAISIDTGSPASPISSASSRTCRAAGAHVDRILVALDVLDRRRGARRWPMQLRGAVGGFKIGSQLFTAAGPSIVRALVDRGDRVFLDLKFHDIPNTVAGAIASAADARRLDGERARERRRRRCSRPPGDAADETAAATGRARPLVIAVTVLTSLDAPTLDVGRRERARRSIRWFGWRSSRKAPDWTASSRRPTRPRPSARPAARTSSS